jgi:Flp pilus assembly CpaF family ATPase
MKHPAISDILVNRFERAGELEPVPNLSFKDNQHSRQIIDRIVSSVGRRVDESSPMVDARLPDSSGVHAMIPPVRSGVPLRMNLYLFPISFRQPRRCEYSRVPGERSFHQA